MPLLLVHLVVLLVVYFPALFVAVHEVLLVGCSWKLGLRVFSCFFHDCRLNFVIHYDMDSQLHVGYCFFLALFVLLVRLVIEVLVAGCDCETLLHRVHLLLACVEQDYMSEELAVLRRW